MSRPSVVPFAEPLVLDALIPSVPHGIASRVLAKTAGGSVTGFFFAAGESLSEHTSPFEAMLLVVTGSLTVTVGGEPVEVGAGTLVRLPGGVPHAVDAPVPSSMLLVMLRDGE